MRDSNLPASSDHLLQRSCPQRGSAEFALLEVGFPSRTHGQAAEFPMGGNSALPLLRKERETVAFGPNSFRRWTESPDQHLCLEEAILAGGAVLAEPVPELALRPCLSPKLSSQRATLVHSCQPVHGFVGGLLEH